MTWIDYSVLIGYFLMMAGIGVICMRLIKAQEDFFMGGRAFGRLLQTFAAFGAGTGAHEPATVGRTIFTSGLSGIWSALMWLFVTPFYWIIGVWYRRMRHMTLGDWFVERYQSPAMGAAYTVFAICFYMMYLSTMFSAISKVAAPLVGLDTVHVAGFADPVGLEYVLVPLIAVVVVIYGVLGGLKAAYWTDLIQGVLIIILSVMLIPCGLWALVEKFGAPETMGTMDGFAIMHQRVSADRFQLFGGPLAGEFPIHYIISLTLLGLVGIVVQPHFIATGGGSAKSENSARVGLVVGNFLKRLCTIGWGLTGLIVLALLADSTLLAEDPDRVWGVATREVLGPLGVGLVGLMLACLLAALMSSADTYMIVTSACVVRNLYTAYVDPNASEKTCLALGRVTGLIIIFGAAGISLHFMNVFGQFKLALEIPIVFAAPFWVGMWWRWAGKWAAWGTMALSLLTFFIVPVFAPMVQPELRTNPDYAVTNQIVTTVTARTATEADVARRRAAIAVWDEAQANLQTVWQDYRRMHDSVSTEDTAKVPDASTLQQLGQEGARLSRALAAVRALGNRPQEVLLGGPIEDSFTTGGSAIFWSDGVERVDEQGKPLLDQSPKIIKEERIDDTTMRITKAYQGPVRGKGSFHVDFLLYQWAGMNLSVQNNAMLETLRLPPRLVVPFLVIIVLGLLTPRNKKEGLDRYFVKMKTPVLPDHRADHDELLLSYENPDRFNDRRLIKALGLEIQKPSLADVGGFVISFVVCFIIIAAMAQLARIGG